MKYNVPGFIELHDVPKVIAEKLKEGDTVTDNNGTGRTVCVNKCDECGKLIFAAVRIMTYISCNFHR
jgi:hypothetical protein